MLHRIILTMSELKNITNCNILTSNAIFNIKSGKELFENIESQFKIKNYGFLNNKVIELYR